MAGQGRRGRKLGFEAPEGGVVVARRHLGVEKLSIGTGGPERGAVRAPEHPSAIARISVEAVGASVATKTPYVETWAQVVNQVQYN